MHVLYIARKDLPPPAAISDLWIQTLDGESDPVAAYSGPESNVGVFRQTRPPVAWAGQPAPPEIVYGPASGGPF